MSKKEEKTTKNKRRLFEKGEESRIRNYFVRLFGKYDFRNEKQFAVFVKLLLYALLILIEIFMLWQQISVWHTDYGKALFFSSLVCASSLALSEGLRLFVFKHGKKDILFSVVDVIFACFILFVAEGTYPLVIYIIILTELYIGASKFRTTILIFGLAMPVYAGCYTAKNLIIAELGFTEII